MSQKVKTPSNLIEWCDQQVAEGKTLGIGWEGGGDSGWCWFTIDGQQVADAKETPQIRELLDLMYETLDYGSWAGEFSASGEAVYDPKQKAFVGTDYYSENQTEHWDCDVQIIIPKDLWFDAIEYNIEDESARVDFAFVIRNGFLSPKHDEVADQIKESLNDAVDAEVTKFCADENTGEYQSIWQSDRIVRSDFREEGDNLVYSIEEVSMTTSDTDEKDIFLTLEYLEDAED